MKIVFPEKDVDIESIIEHPIDIENLSQVQEDDIEPVGESNEDNPMKVTYEEKYRSKERERKPPRRLFEDISNYAEHCFMTESLTSESDEPKSPSEALNGEHSDQWKEAMDSEYSSLLKNETWELVPPTEGKNIVGSHWTFKSQG